MKIVEDKKRPGVLYESLNATDCFRLQENDNDLWLKTDFDQDAVSLVDGEYISDMCGETVFPVAVELHVIG